MSFRCEQTTVQLLEQMAHSEGKTISELLLELIQKGIDAPAKEKEIRDQLKAYEEGTTNEVYEKYKGRTAYFFDEKGDLFTVDLNEKKDLQLIYYHTLESYKKYRKKYGDDYL